MYSGSKEELEQTINRLQNDGDTEGALDYMKIYRVKFGDGFIDDVDKEDMLDDFANRGSLKGMLNMFPNTDMKEFVKNQRPSENVVTDDDPRAKDIDRVDVQQIIDRYANRKDDEYKDLSMEEASRRALNKIFNGNPEADLPVKRKGDKKKVRK